MAAAAKQQKIEAAVDEALRLGKMAPSQRKHWVTSCTHEEGMLDVLTAVSNQAVVPMTEIGHSGEPADSEADKPPGSIRPTRSTIVAAAYQAARARPQAAPPDLSPPGRP